jgi:hypothetical protein
MLREGLDFLLQRGTGKNKSVEIAEVGEGEPADGFGSKLGDGRVKLNQSPPTLEDDMLPGRVIETDDLRENINPERIHQNRSKTERIADESKDAEITTDPLEWAAAPDEHDFPGVDTGPVFEEEFGDSDFDDFGRF